MGTVTVSDNAIAQIVENAIKECDGFAQMSDKTKVGEAARKVSRNMSGVRIIKTKDGIKLDVYIACKHGADTKALQRNATDAVKSAFPCTGIAINDVVIHINDVR